jgi:hypothetical protein
MTPKTSALETDKGHNGELSERELDRATGGLNPQPLPPKILPR